MTARPSSIIFVCIFSSLELFFDFLVTIFLYGQNDTFSGEQNDKKISVLLDAYDSNIKSNFQPTFIVTLPSQGNRKYEKIMSRSSVTWSFREIKKIVYVLNSALLYDKRLTIFQSLHKWLSLFLNNQYDISDCTNKSC
jgi:hypothetical protein